MGKLARRIGRWLGLVSGLCLVAVVAGGVWIHGRLTASLAQLDGERVLPGLSRPVTVERDALGVPVIRGSNREDVARATGFLHAQDRFFQMDLLRRSAAGELAALAGPGLLARDRRARVHRFRATARRYVEQADPEDRALLRAYSEGVNAGLAALRAAPPEYLLLRAKPAAWLPEDTALVVLAMYLELQAGAWRRESAMGVLSDVLPEELVAFLTPPGSEWDAPILGEPLAAPSPPPASVFDLRRLGPSPAAAAGSGRPERLDAGSNSWAVDGAHAANGALLANDIHLPLAMPNIWYRAVFVWPDESDPGGEHRVVGATLPGAPPMIVGANGDVAWSFTNSQGDWSDLVVLEGEPGDDDVYLTPGGPRRFERIEERIEVAGAEDETLELLWTIWGPVIDRDDLGRRRVLRWVAHDPRAVNMGLDRMSLARDLDEALRTAARSRIPEQNCVVADREGRIGWTVMGPIPRRVGFDGTRPVTWSNGDRRWDGYLDASEVPRITDPPGGRIWTANNRVVGGAALERIGDGGFASGARARQIRDDLLDLERAAEPDLLAVQLDDRARFLARWRELLLAVLDEEALEADPRRRDLRAQVDEGWTGRASIDSVGYRMVRAFRVFLAQEVFEAITAPCRAVDPRFDFLAIGRWEGPLWKLVTERPPQLLDPRYESWRDQLLAAADRILDTFLDDDHPTLDGRTWGQRNTVRIQHPLSLAVPYLSRWLDLPSLPLPGDSHMPRVQGVRFGASLRMVVSPGREEAGIFEMPGGQSGHPLSPYYRKGHEAWVRGEPTPLLPGPPVHHLSLLPQRAPTRF